MDKYDQIAKTLLNLPRTPKASYYNGFYSSGKSGGAKWDHGLSASGSGICLNHNELRINARTAYFESSQAKAIVNRMADSVAGTGIEIEPLPKTELLGISLEEGERWGEDVRSRFDSFARSKKQNRSEIMNLYQASRFYEICNQRDGETFVRLYYAPDKTLLNPLQFEFIDPSQIRGTAFTNTVLPVLQNDGIEKDARGRAKAYKIWYRSGNEYKYETIPAKSQKTDRLFMLHGFAPEFPGQTRGYSRIAHALQEFENITDFTQAQIKKAINQSNINMYVKPSKDNPASNPFEDILNNTAGPVGQFGANPVPCDTAQNVTPESLCPVNYFPIPEATLGVAGSTSVFNLLEGEDLKPFENSAPSDSFDSFVGSFTSYLAASMSMPIEVLLMKFNSNYSASRAALILFWQVAQIWRQEQVTDFLSQIYEMWLSEEIAAGRIRAPGWLNPTLRSAWLNARWIGPVMPNIDPLKTYQADRGYLELCATNQDRIARDYNGSSGKANRAINKRTFLETPPAPWNIKEQKQTGDKEDE